MLNQHGAVRVSAAGWLIVLVPLLAAYLFGTSRQVPFWLSIAVAGLAFWSIGIMHNFAYNRDDPQAAPDWAAQLGMLATIAGVALLVWALLT